MIRRVSAAVGVATMLLACAQSALAAGDPVAERQALMKQIALRMKEASGLAAQQTFDPAKVKPVTDSLAASAKKARGLFPAGSGATGSADPKIWTNKADFDKRMAELSRLSTAAGAATSHDAYASAFRQLAGTCKGCHDVYRKKAS